MRTALRAARKKKNMTQAQVACVAGIDRASYTHLERGTRNPSVEVALTIAQVLGCSIEELFGHTTVSLRNSDIEQATTRESA